MQVFKPWFFFVAMMLVLPWVLVAGVRTSIAGSDSLAVFDLRVVNMEAMGFNSDIIYHFISEIEKNKNIDILPRREMQESLFQQGLSLSDNEKDVLKAGKFLGVKYIFFGSVEKRNSDGMIHSVIKLMDIHTSSVVLKESIDFMGKADIHSRISALSDKIEHIANTSGPKKSSSFDSNDADADTKARSIFIHLNARACSQGIRLTWQIEHESEKIKTYYVYRSENKTGPFRLLSQLSDSTYVDASVSSNRRYYYRVDMLSTTGFEYSTQWPVSAKKRSVNGLKPPIIMKYQGRARSAVIEFISNLSNKKLDKKVEHYNVYRRDNDSEDWRFVASIKINPYGKNNYSYCDSTRLVDGKEYQYVVSSSCSNGDESEYSPSVSIRTLPLPQLSLTKSGLLRAVLLAWQPVEGAHGYCLYRKTNGGDWERIQKFDKSGICRHRDEKKLTDGVDYIYRLTAYDEAGGETMPSNIIKAFTKKTLPPPGQLEAQSGLLKQVVLTWKPLQDDDVGGYTIYRQSSGKSFQKVISIKNGGCEMYVDKGSVFQKLLDGTTYSYYVATFNLFEAEGTSSKKVSARTKPVPEVVKGISVSSVDDCITVRWQVNPETDIDHYTISRKDDFLGWRKIKELPWDIHEYEDRNLKPDKNYQYSIFATDKDALEGDPGESQKIQSPILK